MARAIVNAGWNLLELKSTTLTLEEIFLELTGAHGQPASPAPVPEEDVSEAVPGGLQ
jgi:hypothetical protein